MPPPVFRRRFRYEPVSSRAEPSSGCSAQCARETGAGRARRRAPAPPCPTPRQADLPATITHKSKRTYIVYSYKKNTHNPPHHHTIPQNMPTDETPRLEAGAPGHAGLELNRARLNLELEWTRPMAAARPPASPVSGHATHDLSAPPLPVSWDVGDTGGAAHSRCDTGGGGRLADEISEGGAYLCRGQKITMPVVL